MGGSSNPSRGELVIYGEGTKIGSAFCCADKARRYPQHECMCYLVYVVDTQDRKEVSVLDLSVVKEFICVFPEDIPVVPRER